MDYTVSSTSVTFAMGDTGGAEQCITVTGINNNDQTRNRRHTITIQFSVESYMIDGTGSDFSAFVIVTIMDDDTGESMCTLA